jgi:hypothetical protein
MNSKRARALFGVLAALMALAAVFVSTAAAREPAPGYGKFAGCPSPEEIPNIEGCLVSTITGGNFKMGSKNVPIKNPITLSGGIQEGDHFVFNKKGGLTPVKQEVPGGVIGITGLDWLINFLNLEGLKLYAVTELAGTPGNPLIDEPYKLPVKIHLINPVLGNNCYVGSNSNPIQLNLITGTTSPPGPNKPITGVDPELKLDETLPGVIDATGGQFVDNSFAAPGASGCVLTLFGFIPISLNGLVNAQSSLPSGAGNNETRQIFNAQLAFDQFVYP